MDTELFELCKEVYSRTKDTWGWTDDMQWIEVNHFNEVSIFPKWRSLSDNSSEVQKHAPLYTSDYLLDKLPTHLGGDETNWLDIYAAYDDATKTWFASYEYASSEPDGSSYSRNADTPLKALLKLTLALHDAGELN